MSASTVTRRIGDSTFPAIGFGAMGIGGRTYGKVVSSENEARFKVLDRLLELGCTHWDTANVYGDSEELIGNWLKRTGQRDKVKIPQLIVFHNSTDRMALHSAKQCLEESLQKLGVDKIDLYYVHRIDKNTPIEVTMNALVEFVKAGKIRHIGLSQPSPATLRRAHKVHPIAAIQVEYSPFERVIEQKGHLLETARELGVAVVAYSPLSKSLLTGQITSHSDFSDTDLRKQIPRYAQENFPKILELVDKFKQIGQAHSATSGQVALAYLLALGDDIIPIPGSQRIEYIEENFSAAQLKLTPEELQTLKKLVNETKIDGDQYPPALQAMLYADTPELP
ncbi:aldo/keto reductase [Rhizoctonia solani AG-3 Rhs1AP]|uniref:Aldo/keto reductase n=2 Tax=Rhizoctonia solani AG-3 TaxID=1086053 RepID=A0A074RRQ7_9AGAM|nr:aldo/keto reductase [Rhizoctonia solani AG-3 Rhs1AP]KEP48015.1 aldo/keto reductase [Rhizoctonia solani 123E]